ncbi:5'-3' exonuclease [Allobranchiibius sp. GilTou38]|uniref:5'-3' exonuclease n=1 Tax=Allobranchiibius sp. GilTou38 TaxID=2815210 RepID=UPI001AA1951F|nr:5'-3' exonuclease [Allobranchiibius sp. GilTou38]MBO1766428.1 5'-3' exonuclease [Allobranchiibius sp. GilTou38]
MTRRLMLLDSASLYFRAFYGVPDRRDSPDMLPTNAIRGFLDMIATLVNDHEPSDLVACWDNDWRPAFRVDAIPSYKAHRVTEGSEVLEESPEDLTPQVPYIVSLLAALGITRLGADGYEADDVIGTLVHTHLGVCPVDVVTGDRDLFQLVDDEASVRVLYTARGGVREPDVIDQSALQAKYAVATGRAYAEMATLRGDTSDGLPGVAGIGEKTAATLLARYGDLAGLRAAIDGGDPTLKGAQRAKLEAASDYLDVAPAVVDVALDVPVPTDLVTALPRKVADPEALQRIVDEIDITTPLRRVLAALNLRG